MPQEPVQFGAQVVRTHMPSGGADSASAFEAGIPIFTAPALATPSAVAEANLTNPLRVTSLVIESSLSYSHNASKFKRHAKFWLKPL